MSAIPPNWLASGIQSAGAQQRAAEAREKDAAQARAAGAAFKHELVDVVENSERDGQVDSDAEGAGSQGKAFSQQPDEQAPQDMPQSSGGPGLDIQA